MAADRPNVLFVMTNQQRYDTIAALEDGELRSFPFEERPRRRIHQLAAWKGVQSFPDHPEEVLEDWELTPPGQFRP